MKKRAVAGLLIAFAGFLLMVLAFETGKNDAANRAVREHKQYQAKTIPVALFPLAIGVTLAGLALFFVSQRKTNP